MTIGFHVPTWTGHLAGQHVDVRLTAPNGYQVERSYSVASAAGTGNDVEITVERIDEGEVSPFLTAELALGDVIELRGPIGGYFIWDPDATPPLLLVGGGSGVVPLMSILRTRDKRQRKNPARLLYSSRTAADIIYRHELDRFQEARDGFYLIHTLTRAAPSEWQGERRRVDREMLAARGFSAAEAPQIFVCGPTAFVETVVDDLLALGHEESDIRTERFGPTGPDDRAKLT